jgi:hypothetical protein
VLQWAGTTEVRGTTVESGLDFEVIWSDQQLIEVVFSCSNGHFSGRAEIYLSHRAFEELAEVLRGFPSTGTDSREVQLGTFDSSHADGGVKMKFGCSDAVGHAVVEVKLRGDGSEALGELESVALRIPIEPAAVDSFVQQLIAMDSTIGARASLPMVT